MGFSQWGGQGRSPWREGDWGAPAQQALTVRDHRRFPPKGLLVAVDGYPMHLQVRGPDTGGPTLCWKLRNGFVLAEPVLGSAGACIDGPERCLRSCRAWLEPSQRPAADAQTIAVELRDAVREAGIEPPYVHAGHSLGSPAGCAFADLDPELTAGLFLIASHTEAKQRSFGRVRRCMVRLPPWPGDPRACTANLAPPPAPRRWSEGANWASSDPSEL